MSFQIERLTMVWSADNGDHWAWRKVRVAGRPVEWKTRREAEGYIDLCYSQAKKRNEVRVVEVAAEVAAQ